MRLSATIPLCLFLLLPLGTPALACGGFVEAPIACEEAGPALGAAYMLKRVATALETDKAGALDAFSRGTRGFRTADTYVFCVGPDGVMSAHPSPILQGHDVRDLHDKTGNYFIRTMMQEAKPGTVSVIRYLFPKPGSTVAVPKTTYYTLAGDQMCGVGVYDGDGPEQPLTVRERIAQLRMKLDGEIPTSVRPDWTAFIEALNAQGAEQEVAMAQVRDHLKAIDTALAPPARAASDSSN